ncbi:hypothetical protein RUND412_003903 [Rhizina undulata]
MEEPNENHEEFEVATPMETNKLRDGDEENGRLSLFQTLKTRPIEVQELNERRAFNSSTTAGQRRKTVGRDGDERLWAETETKDCGAETKEQKNSCEAWVVYDDAEYKHRAAGERMS